MSFGENVAGEGRIVDSAAKSAASRVSWFNRMGNRSGVKADDETESNTSVKTPPNFDVSDPEVIGNLLSRPPKPINHSPTSTIKFNEQTVVMEYTQSGNVSTTIGNLGGTTNKRSSSSLPGSAALHQHTLAGGTSNGGNSGSNNDPNSSSSSGGNASPNDNPNGNPNGNPNPGNSGGHNDGGDQGRTSGGIDPRDSGPDPRNLSKIILDFGTRGGPLERWGIQGTIPVGEFFRFTGVRDPHAYEWMLQCKRQLIRPEIIDRVADRMGFLYQHNDWN